MNNGPRRPGKLRRSLLHQAVAAVVIRYEFTRHGKDTVSPRRDRHAIRTIICADNSEEALRRKILIQVHIRCVPRGVLLKLRGEMVEFVTRVNPYPFL